MESKMQERLLLKKQYITDWHNSFKEATDYDVWGQPVEAITFYNKTAKSIKKEAQEKMMILFTTEEKKVLTKIAVCAEMRVKALQRAKKLETISIEEMKAIEEILFAATKSESFQVIEINQLTVWHDNFVLEGSLRNPDEEDLEFLEKSNEKVSSCSASGGRMLPQPALNPGKSVIVCRITYIDIKDASSLVNPCIGFTVRDNNGIAIGPIQETPPSVQTLDTEVHFNIPVYVQTALEDLPKDFTVFLEMKHFKPKKKKFSVLCWALLDADEIVEGDKILELYKKPVDHQKKKLHLLTTKPFYLHMNLSIYTS